MSLHLLLICMTLASYRLSRLLVEDDFPPIAWARNLITWPYTQPQTSFARQNTKVPYWLAYLVQCYWCMNVWTSACLTFMVWLTVGLPVPWLIWLAVAAAASLTSHVEEYLTR